jgi:Ca-activated chloride channel family protein
MALSVDAAVDRPLIPAADPCERYLMLTLRASEGAARLPLNLALVLDTSGSMNGSKLARVKEAAGFVARHLTSVDRLAVVTYDDEARVAAPSVPLTLSARTDLLYRLSRIEAGGWTNLSQGWATGCEEVATSGTAERQANRVLLLTDGLANVGTTDPGELVEHARRWRDRGVVTSTMGVGADFDEELLEALAKHGGGRFQYVETAAHVPDCVQGELGELLQLSARKVALEVHLPERVRFRGCLNDDAVERTADGVRVRVDDLVAADVRRVVLRLAVETSAEPARTGAEAAGALLAIRALALYVDVATGRGTELAFPPVELRTAARRAVESQAPRAEVEAEVALLVAAHARREAARLSVLGDHRAAAQTLATAGQALGASARASEPAVAAQIAALAHLAADAGRGLDRAERKELRYQSYLLRVSKRRYDQSWPDGSGQCPLPPGQR